MQKIITISGGLTSAYVAKLVLASDENAELVFTDTGWEDADLFRFLHDLENLFNKKITFLKHKKYNNPEELFYGEKMLGSNAHPNCSKILKVQVLQTYLRTQYKNKCVVYFGIDYSEKHRADRIRERYSKKNIDTRFPLVESKDFFIKDKITSWLNENNIEIPRLYKNGYLHNNCAGGCVRMSKKYWIHLLKDNPELYKDRERIELEFSNNKYTFIDGITLKKLRENEEVNSNLFSPVDDSACMCFEV